MPKFIVTFNEMWTQEVEIEAKNGGDALKKVLDGEGEYGKFEYSYTLEDSYSMKKKENNND